MYDGETVWVKMDALTNKTVSFGIGNALIKRKLDSTKKLMRVDKDELIFVKDIRAWRLLTSPKALWRSEEIKSSSGIQVVVAKQKKVKKRKAEKPEKVEKASNAKMFARGCPYDASECFEWLLEFAPMFYTRRIDQFLGTVAKTLSKYKADQLRDCWRSDAPARLVAQNRVEDFVILVQAVYGKLLAEREGRQERVACNLNIGLGHQLNLLFASASKIILSVHFTPKGSLSPTGGRISLERRISLDTLKIPVILTPSKVGRFSEEVSACLQEDWFRPDGTLWFPKGHCIAFGMNSWSGMPTPSGRTLAIDGNNVGYGVSHYADVSLNCLEALREHRAVQRRKDFESIALSTLDKLWTEHGLSMMVMASL